MNAGLKAVLFAALAAIVVVSFDAGPAVAGDYLEYLGSIPTGRSLGRIVADPVRSKVYGITGSGDVVFIDRTTMSVDKVIQTGRALRDMDISHDGSTVYVLDNVTGEYWNQPPAVYVLGYDLDSQSPASIVVAQRGLYQMAMGRPNRLLGVTLNQWVGVCQVDMTTGAVVGGGGGGYYGSAVWVPQTFVSNNDGTRLYRTEVGISSIDLIVWDTSTDGSMGGVLQRRNVGSYATEPICLNSTDTSLYCGDLRLDPSNIGIVLGLFPETIYAGTGDDRLAFGRNNVYDPVWGTILEGMPVQSSMLALGEGDQYLYAVVGQDVHVMRVVPVPEPPHIEALEVFYNGKYADAADPAKTFLAVGEASQMSLVGDDLHGNVTNYLNGITGIRVTFDMVVTFSVDAAAAFSYEATPEQSSDKTFTAFPPLTSPVYVVDDSSGKTVVTITFSDGEIKNRWLKTIIDASQVSANSLDLDGELPSPLTLPSGDGAPGGNAEFIIGHRFGDVDGNYRCLLNDAVLVRNQVSGATVVGISNAYDVDKNERVLLNDAILARNAVSGTALPALP